MASHANWDVPSVHALLDGLACVPNTQSVALCCSILPHLQLRHVAVWVHLGGPGSLPHVISALVPSYPYVWFLRWDKLHNCCLHTCTCTAANKSGALFCLAYMSRFCGPPPQCTHLHVLACAPLCVCHWRFGRISQSLRNPGRVLGRWGLWVLLCGCAGSTASL